MRARMKRRMSRWARDFWVRRRMVVASLGHVGLVVYESGNMFQGVEGMVR